MSPPNGNLFTRFEAVFEEHAEEPCLRLPDRPAWSYERLLQHVRRLARVLRDAGVGCGDRVLVQAEKSPDLVALYLATLQIGAVYVPLNTTYTPREVEYFVTDADPSILVTGTANSTELPPGIPRFTIGEDGDGSLRSLVDNAEPDPTVSRVNAGDTAAILYTSGTTGQPKGAMLTHANLLSNAQALIEYWGWQPDDVLLHALPIYHVHGLFVALHCVFLTGTSMWLLPNFDLDELLRFLPSTTVLMGVPTFYIRLLQDERFDRGVAKNVRVFISGSAPLSEKTFAEFRAKTGQSILERYGMSETLMNTSNPLEGERVAGSVGYALSGVEVRVVNEHGDVQPTREVGEIELRGTNVFSGYWRKPQKTADEFRSDGFFRTGDMGFLAEDGRLSIVGREKDVVISGGLNVYPAEVESAIEEIAGVRECAVIGAPHPDFGEGVVAVIVGDSQR